MKIEGYFSALSALLTVSGVFYGLWYGEIQRLKKSQDKWEDSKDEILSCIWGKCVPLLIISLGTLLLFLYPVFDIVLNSIRFVISRNAVYDSEKAVFLFLVAIIAGLCVLSLKDIHALYRKKSK